MNETEKRIATCLNCGKKFRMNGWNQEYCSPECRKEAVNRRAREARKEAAEAGSHIRKCKLCGKKFELHNPNQWYCCPAHRAMAERERANAKRRKKKPEPKPKPEPKKEPAKGKSKGTCIICGKPLDDIPYVSKYCSGACAAEADRRRQAAKRKTPSPDPSRYRTCQNCGKTFTGYHKDQKFCCRACADQAKRTKEYTPRKNPYETEPAIFLVMQDIPVDASMRPKVGQFYRGHICKARVSCAEVWVIDGFGKYGIVVRMGEVKRIA